METCSVFELMALLLVLPVALEEELDAALPPDGMPVTDTWCPTWFFNMVLSPCNCQLLPESSVNMKLPSDPLRHPRIVWLELILFCVAD